MPRLGLGDIKLRWTYDGRGNYTYLCCKVLHRVHTLKSFVRCIQSAYFAIFIAFEPLFIFNMILRPL